MFASLFPAVAAGGPITFDMFGAATAEFEFTLTFATAPVDLFAQGVHNAMTDQEKRGALLFFGKARCVDCHAVAGRSNEMFSDFQNHCIGVPQIAPAFGNFPFLGPAEDEDFGLEDITGNAKDRYKFRTSPLRNLALQPAFFHNGCFTRLEDAVRHHLDVKKSARNYDPAAAGVDADLHHVGPIEPVLRRVDSRLKRVDLKTSEFRDLVQFLRTGLLDPRALPENLMPLIPDAVPSGRPTLTFE